MEYQLRNQTVEAYQEYFCQVKRCQLVLDSVVPDVNDDIGQVASVQSTVLLKSKDQVGRGAFITGEVQVFVIYVTENGMNLASVKTSKEFDVDYEIGESNSDTQMQIRFTILNAEARVLNPRKISVNVEICAELCAYRRQEIPVYTYEPEGLPAPTHMLRKETVGTAIRAVCEKSVAFQEQYAFDENKEEAQSLLSWQIRYRTGETQQIGSRLIVKGEMEVDVCWLSDRQSCPIYSRFRSPFSHILEIGQESCDHCTVTIETTSSYMDLSDGADGGKVLNAEVHALIQVVGRSRHSVSYIADAYSNRIPLNCQMQEQSVPIVSAVETKEMRQDVKITAAEDCSDVLCVLPAGVHVSAVTDRITGSVDLDLIYQNQNGDVIAARRSVTLSEEGDFRELRIMDAWLELLSVIPDGREVRGYLSMTVEYQTTDRVNYSSVCSLDYEEERTFDLESVPSLNLVFSPNEDLWSLAKHYHSSIDSISALNEPDQAMLLIPREN